MQHVLIGRGKVGWHSDGLSHGNKCSSSGGTLEGYLSEAQDGTLIYDALEADQGAYVDFVIKGPMVDPTLPEGAISKFGSQDKAALLGMLPALSGAFIPVAVLALADIGSMDFVAPDVYVQMLREKVPGAKVGKVHNHQVVWEES